MLRLISSLLLCSLSVLAEETTTSPSLLNVLTTREDTLTRAKRQCGAGGCGGGCRGGFGCGTGGGGCRGTNCGGGCTGSRCYNNNYNSCANRCGNGGRLCCDNVAPRPCVGCGLNRGIFPEPVPVAVGVGVGGCCACCMPVCAPRCISFGCGSCGGFGGGYGGYGGGYGFGGFDYFDYLG